MKIILITVWNRAEKLKECLNSLSQLKAIDEYRILIVQQDEFPEVTKVITEISWTKPIVLKTFGENRTGVQNITRNRILGYEKAFYELNATIVYGMEDDVILGFDALVFSESIIEKYKADKKFRGVNLFSGEKFEEKTKFKYGKFRFGISGQSWSITREIWDEILRTNILNDHKNMGLDGLLEGYLKSGFVVMPYCSRYIDIGWGGTHAPDDPMASYFKKLEESWVGIEPFEIKKYEYDNQLEFNWRRDCVKYKSSEDLMYLLLYLTDRLRKKLNLQIRNRIRLFIKG